MFKLANTEGPQEGTPLRFDCRVDLRARFSSPIKAQLKTAPRNLIMKVICKTTGLLIIQMRQWRFTLFLSLCTHQHPPPFLSNCRNCENYRGLCIRAFDWIHHVHTPKKHTTFISIGDTIPLLCVTACTSNGFSSVASSENNAQNVCARR